MMEMLGCTGVPELRIRQEDLVTSTGPVLERILTGLGVPFRPEDLAFVSDGRVVLHANHTVMGSPLRLRTGPLSLQLDDQWKTALGRRPTALVTALTRPLLRRYGYR